MVIFIISFCFILLAMLAMSIGLLFGKDGIKGSCNGLNSMLDGDHSCEHCSGNCKVNNSPTVKN